MSNPFNDSLDGLRGQEVVAVSGDGVRYRGYVERVHHQDCHVVLRGAERDHGHTTESVGRAFVANCDHIHVVDAERIEELRLAALESSPYHVREFDVEDNERYIQQVASNGWVGSFPTVRMAGGSYEILAGHKRVWAARQAGLDTHPVEVVDVDDWTATRRWALDHLPEYDEGETREAVDRLVEDWGEQASEIPGVELDDQEDDVGDSDETEPAEPVVDEQSPVDDVQEDSDADGPVSSLLSLDYFEDMNGAIDTDAEVTVILGDEMPVTLQYERADGDVAVEYMLAPRVQKDGGEA